MVKLEFYKAEDFENLNYDLDEIQKKFTATVALALDRIAIRNEDGDFLAKAVSIYSEDIPVGFLVLDFGADKFSLSDNQNSVLVRSFSVNPLFQGKGFGKSAMFLIVEFVKIHFPKTNEIVLGVNNINNVAFQIYLAAGFKFFGKTRRGRSGLQKILTKKI